MELDIHQLKKRFIFPPPEDSEMQDGVHFTATQLVRAGIS
jgi:hypothetical protein